MSRTPEKITRREFLIASCLTAAGVVVTACSPKREKPIPTPEPTKPQPSQQLKKPTSELIPEPTPTLPVTIEVNQLSLASYSSSGERLKEPSATTAPRELSQIPFWQGMGREYTSFVQQQPESLKSQLFNPQEGALYPVLACRGALLVVPSRNAREETLLLSYLDGSGWRFLAEASFALKELDQRGVSVAPLSHTRSLVQLVERGSGEAMYSFKLEEFLFPVVDKLPQEFQKAKPNQVISLCVRSEKGLFLGLGLTPENGKEPCTIFVPPEMEIDTQLCVPNTPTTTPSPTAAPPETVTPTPTPKPTETPTRVPPTLTPEPTAAPEKPPEWVPKVSNTVMEYDKETGIAKYFDERTYDRPTKTIIVRARADPNQPGGYEFFRYAKEIASNGNRSLLEVYPELFIRENGDKILPCDVSQIVKLRVKPAKPFKNGRSTIKPSGPTGLELHFNQYPVSLYWPFKKDGWCSTTIKKRSVALNDINPARNLWLSLYVFVGERSTRDSIRKIKNNEDIAGNGMRTRIRTKILHLTSDGIVFVGSHQYLGTEHDSLNRMELDTFRGSKGRLRY